MWALILLLLAPDTPRLEVHSFPPISLAFPSRPAYVTVTAELKGPETEEFYCPEVVFISGFGINRIESKVEQDCVPFEERNVVPPIPPECQMRLRDGSIIVPACYHNTRTAPGFPRRWTRRYVVGQCQIEGETCQYTVTVELRRNGRTFKTGSTNFIVQ